MKDWCLGAISKLVWRAKLAWKRAVPDPSSPLEVGEWSTLAAQGMLGGTDTMGCRVDFFVKMGKKLQ